MTAAGHLHPAWVRRCQAFPGLLLFPDRDVVHGLPLRVRACGRDRHRFPILGDDSARSHHHLLALFVRAFDGPGIDALEGHRVGVLGPCYRIVLAVVLRRVLRPRGCACRVDALRGGFLPLAGRLNFHCVTLGGRAGIVLGLLHVELPRAEARIARLGGHVPEARSQHDAERHHDSENHHTPDCVHWTTLLPVSELQAAMGGNLISLTQPAVNTPTPAMQVEQVVKAGRCLKNRCFFETHCNLQ